MTKILSLLSVLTILGSCHTPEETKPPSSGDVYYDKAYDFFLKNEKDSAFVNFSLAKDEFVKYDLRSKVGNCLVNMSLIQAGDSDFFGAQETALLALSYLDEYSEADRPDFASLYNNLAITSHRLKDYDQAIKYYKLAIGLTDDGASKLMFINNVAVIYKDLKQSDKAIVLWQDNLSSVMNTGKAELINKYKDNLEFTKFLKNPSYRAEAALLEVLNSRLKTEDLAGLNASYAHLSSYYETKNPKKSLHYANKMYENATYRKAPDDRIQALQNIAVLTTGEEGKSALKKMVVISDSLALARTKAKNQFAVVRYESLKNLNKFLTVKSENESRKRHIITQYGLIIGLALVIVIIVLWYTKRRRQMEQQKTIDLANNELKMSKKVHDVVANGLYQIMVELENKKDVSQVELLGQLELLYEGSRDLSHNMVSARSQPFHIRIMNLLSSYSNESTKVFVIGNNEALWEHYEQNIREELYTVLRELMINMRKHAHATMVSVKFEIINHTLTITYTDNGVGISHCSGENKGKGLQNMENRIASISGQINFENNPKGGLITSIRV